MKVLETINQLSKEETLKYAYAFMQTESLKIKECNFINPKPQNFDSRYILPQDSYSISYDNKLPVPSWEDFKKNSTHLSSPGFVCVASIDPQDTKRVNLTALNNSIFFTIYGNYEKEAKKALKDIELICKKLV